MASGLLPMLSRDLGISIPKAGLLVTGLSQAGLFAAYSYFSPISAASVCCFTLCALPPAIN
jgi:predicted MFS family arabinose efflux permease